MENGKQIEDKVLPTEPVFRVKRGLFSSEIEIRGYHCPECQSELVPEVRIMSGTIGDKKMILKCVKCGYEKEVL